mgnify:FL=1
MKKFFLILLLLTAVSPVTFAQFDGYNWKGGVQFNYLYPTTELTSDKFSFLGRGFINKELNKYLELELGFGFGRYLMTDELTGYPNTDRVESTIIPIDLRLKYTPFHDKNVNPYLYVGFGLLRYYVTWGSASYNPEGENTPGPFAGAIENGWTGFPTAGIGSEFRIANGVFLDLTAGYSYYLSDMVNNVKWGDLQDGAINAGLGLTFTGPADADDDLDGLMTSYEETIGTDPMNPDTDGDGLKDGEEVKKYNTNPLAADSDNDGLNDGEEVLKYKTNPVNPDTDGDGLKDGEEVQKYNTDPLNPDTDGDGLNDGSEVSIHKTNPLKSDTDGDGLSDGDEVNRYKTNPLKADTDGGTVNDGIEVGRGTNPLEASDDVEKKKEMQVGEVLILEGINFETNSSSITSESEEILMKSLEYINAHPDESYEISGHTDSRGTRAKNMKLSEDRATSVMNWLISHGVSSSRLKAIGYGPDNPIAPNDTPENMYKNRRIEFKRVK